MGSWPRHKIGSYCILSCITRQPLPTYQISLKSNKLYNGRTDISDPLIRSTRRSQSNNSIYVFFKKYYNTHPTTTLNFNRNIKIMQNVHNLGSKGTHRLSRIKRSSKPALRSSICFSWLRWARTSPDFLCNTHYFLTKPILEMMRYVQTAPFPAWWEGEQSYSKQTK